MNKELHCIPDLTFSVEISFKGCREQVVDLVDSELLVSVADQGDGFDPSGLPDPTAAGNLYEGHGRGVFLMRRFVDKVEFHLGPAGNSANVEVMVRPINTSALLVNVDYGRLRRA